MNKTLSLVALCAVTGGTLSAAIPRISATPGTHAAGSARAPQAAPAAVARPTASAPAFVVQRQGADRITVAIDCPDSAYTRCLKRNLQLSGLFTVMPSGSGAIIVKGTPGASVTATGSGKALTSSDSFASDKEARLAARKFADEIVAAFVDGAKGFAQTRIAFAQRKGSDNGELFMTYPDGLDLRQLTSDAHAAIAPRWAPNGRDIYYTGFLQKRPLVYRLDSVTGKRQLLAQFKGLATGAAISPDGTKCAIILSYQGNPELYVLTLATGVASRMTVTPAAAEASPCWSPDGRKIAYVSDTTRHPQIYIVDVATKKSTRFTSVGVENTNPDWSADNRLTWASKQGGGANICVADMAKGAGSARVVTTGGGWEHPSWTPDGRHLVASQGKTLFLVDTDPEGDKPFQIVRNSGNWMNPACTH